MVVLFFFPPKEGNILCVAKIHTVVLRKARDQKLMIMGGGGGGDFFNIACSFGSSSRPPYSKLYILPLMFKK